MKYRIFDRKNKQMLPANDNDFIESIVFDSEGKPLKATVKEFVDFEARYITINILDFDLIRPTDVIDLRGEEIYEGDIIYDRVHDTNGKYYESFLPVFFENGAFRVDESLLKDRSYSSLLSDWNNPKTVGNIYENPELLKTK